MGSKCNESEEAFVYLKLSLATFSRPIFEFFLHLLESRKMPYSIYVGGKGKAGKRKLSFRSKSFALSLLFLILHSPARDISKSSEKGKQKNCKLKE